MVLSPQGKSHRPVRLFSGRWITAAVHIGIRTQVALLGDGNVPDEVGAGCGGRTRLGSAPFVTTSLGQAAEVGTSRDWVEKQAEAGAASTTGYRLRPDRRTKTECQSRRRRSRRERGQGSWVKARRPWFRQKRCRQGKSATGRPSEKIYPAIYLPSRHREATTATRPITSNPKAPWGAKRR